MEELVVSAKAGQARPLGLQAHHKLCSQVLCVCRASAIAKKNDLPT